MNRRSQMITNRFSFNLSRQLLVKESANMILLFKPEFMRRISVDM